MRGGLGKRTERERCWRSRKMRWGRGGRDKAGGRGAYVERLGGPEEAGWGVRGGTVGPALKGRERGQEGRETEQRPGKWSAVSTALPPRGASTVPAAPH